MLVYPIMIQKFDKYSLSLIALVSVVLIRSYANTSTPYLFCVGEKSFNKEDPSEIIDEPRKAILMVTKENHADLISQGKAVLSLCGLDDIEVNNNQFMVLPQIFSGKNTNVFTSLRDESLEITRWVKNDSFLATYQSPAVIGTRKVTAQIKMACSTVKSFPKNPCSL